MKFMGARNRSKVLSWSVGLSSQACRKTTLLVWLVGAAALTGSACGDHVPDPRTVEGVLAYMAQALEADDGERLYRVLDERSRHALISIHADRRAAADVVRASYPEDERADALAALGEATEASTPEALFAMRCDRGCRDELVANVGAPTEERRDGDELVVTTSRGELRFHRAREGQWWGFVWKTEELDRERDVASRDLRQIRRNAEVFQRRDDLE
jgi:hypothetical protein